MIDTPFLHVTIEAKRFKKLGIKAQLVSERV